MVIEGHFSGTMVSFAKLRGRGSKKSQVKRLIEKGQRFPAMNQKWGFEKEKKSKVGIVRTYKEMTRKSKAA